MFSVFFISFMIFMKICNFSNKDTKRDRILLENLIILTNFIIFMKTVIFQAKTPNGSAFYWKNCYFSLIEMIPLLLLATGLNLVLNWSRILSFLENSSVFSVKVTTFEKGKTPFYLGKISGFLNQRLKALWKYIVLLYSTKKSMHFSVNAWSLKLWKTRKEIL